jgi:hypothetical protein
MGKSGHPPIINGLCHSLRGAAGQYASSWDQDEKAILTIFPHVLDLPYHTPRGTAIVRAFPVPIELVSFDVIPDHALFAGFAPDNCITYKDHSAIIKLAREIEVASIVIHPGLTPNSAFPVI